MAGGGGCTGPGRVKTAVTAMSASAAIWQVVETPLQAPLQPVKETPESGIAWSTNCAPLATWTVQLSRQSVPPPRTIPSPEVVMRSETAVPPPAPLCEGPGDVPQAASSVAAEAAVISARARKPASPEGSSVATPKWTRGNGFRARTSSGTWRAGAPSGADPET